jgi:hypothetical protein
MGGRSGPILAFCSKWSQQRPGPSNRTALYRTKQGLYAFAKDIHQTHYFMRKGMLMPKKPQNHQKPAATELNDDDLDQVTGGLVIGSPLDMGGGCFGDHPANQSPYAAGDEAGSRSAKSGVLSSKNGNRFNQWSPDVKFEGRNTVRRSDMWPK